MASLIKIEAFNPGPPNWTSATTFVSNERLSKRPAKQAKCSLGMLLNWRYIGEGNR